MILDDRADPTTRKIKPPKPPPLRPRSVCTFVTSTATSLVSLVGFRLSLDYYQREIEHDPVSSGTAWWPLALCLLVSLFASYWAVKSGYWLYLLLHPELLDPERERPSVSEAEAHRLVHKGRPPVVELVDGESYRYMPLDLGKGMYWFLLLGGSTCGGFLFWGTFAYFLPWVGPIGIAHHGTALVVGSVVFSILALGMGTTFLLGATYGAVALWLFEDQIQLQGDQIVLSRRGKTFRVDNIVTKRISLKVSGGSCFGELEWFGNPGNRIVVDRRYLVPEELP